MTKKIFLRVFLAALSLFTVGNGYSQTPGSSPKQALTFRTLGADCAPEGLNYLSGSNTVALSVQLGARSQPQTYLGGSPLVLFRSIPGKDGKPIRVPVASVDISQAGTFPLLVFIKGPKGIDHPIVSVLREDAKSFPAGMFRIVNYSTNSLKAVLPAGPVSVAPTSIKEYQGKDGGIFPVGISQLSSSGSILLFNSNLGILPGARIMFLAIPPASPGGNVLIQNVSDAVPAQ
jgi:hypothetical protein